MKLYVIWKEFQERHCAATFAAAVAIMFIIVGVRHLL